MRLDAHQHFWKVSNPFTSWPTPDDGGIYRDFEPSELAEILAANGIDRTILVQAAPDIAETRWCLDLANRHNFVAGVVGWVDFEAPDAVEQIDAIASDAKLLGLRPMVQSIEQPGWLLQGSFSRIFQCMLDHRLRFDGLVLPSQIPDIEGLATLHPALPIVLDHAGKPPIHSGQFSRWAHDLEKLASHPNVFCKLSGLWTEAGSDHGLDRIKPWVTHILNCFGAARVMWGSDWPVLNSAGSYDGWLEQCTELLCHLSEEAIADIMGNNGARFYGI